MMKHPALPHRSFHRLPFVLALAAAVPLFTAAAPMPALGGPVAEAGPVTPGAAPNFRAIVKRFGPAVVGVNVVGSLKDSDDDGDEQASGSNSGIPPELAPFFNGRVPKSRGPVHGQGSGFIVSADGLVLTNAHVVKGADRVMVKLSDHRELKAKVLGSDAVTDIAVLKIDAHDLPTVQIGNSDELAVGDYVLAIGQPYGFEESATSGIVSAKGRSLPGESVVPFIQTDVAVNPGNSGGPLFDGTGSVVGINSQIYSNTGGYEGLSFAIPIRLAMQVKDQIVATGTVAHARLGVTVQPLTQSLAQSFHLDKPSGALVSSVTPDSAAAKAGLQPGDVILAYNGSPIDDAGELSARVGMARPGDRVPVQVWRDRKPLEITVQLGSIQAVAKNDAAGDGNAKGRLGLAVRPLTPSERQEAGVPSGLLIENATGPSALAGIQSGDIVLSVNGTSVSSAEQLRSLVARQGDADVALLIVRGDERLFVPVTPG